MERAYGTAVETAGDHGRIPVLLVNVPCYGRHGVDVGAGMTPAQAAADAQISAFQNDPVHQNALNDVLTRVAAGHPNVRLLDMRQALCPGGAYTDRIDGAVVRTDGVHLSPEGVALWWRRFLPDVTAATGR